MRLSDKKDEWVRETKMRLAHGHDIVVYGPRCIRKSSVAHEILRQLREDGVYTASVDLSCIANIEEFATQLMQSVLDNRIGGDLAPEINTLEPIDLLEAAFEKAENIARGDDKRIVILLDEFQRIVRFDPSGNLMLKRLRSIFQRQQHTSYFFLGSDSLIKTIFADHRQAFYRFATMLKMPPIQEQDLRE